MPRYRPASIRLLLLLLCVLPVLARAEGMLQFFNTDWREITRRIPEIAEAGYDSLWLPPPTKGSGGLSVGYDCFDRFDLGSKDQRGTVRTFYGTDGELIELIETAHRFGLRVYLDTITNHNAFDVPGYDENTPIDLYPGFVPEDFHLRKTSDGFYRKWDNVRDWNDAWQVQNLGISDLIDIAQENPNTNHGKNEGDDIPKIVFVRHPNNPEYYLDTDLPQTLSGGGVTVTVYPFANKEPFQDVGYMDNGVLVGAGNGRFDFKDLNGNGQHDPGEPCEPFTDTGVDPLTPGHNTAAWGYGDGKYNMGNPVPEDVNAMLIRNARWVMDHTRCDGFRLDAVKHVPDYFFGQQSGGNKNSSNAGFIGGAQEQFNLVRGFSDWDNHRDTVFDTEKPRDDAMMFGEHLGEPPGYDGYFNAGMRLIDNPLRNEMNNRLGNPSSTLQGFDQPGAGGFAPGLGVMHAQSHDNDYSSRRELQHAYYFTRAGLPLIYTDGYNEAGVLEGSGGAFPRHANTAFLGQFNDARIPNVVYIHNHLARGDQVGRFSDADFVAYERIDKRENTTMSDSDGVTLLFMMNDNYASGQARNFATAFPNQGGTSNDAYLFNYSTYNGGFYTYASNLGSVVVPPGGYFAFGWRSPEQPNVFAGSEVPPITIQQGGQAVGTVAVTRKDGRNGDPAFNPYGLPDADQTDYSYTMNIPRVTDGSNLSFLARADGSAENILMELDGGVDLNSQLGLGPTGTGDNRDNKPAIATDVFLGYEQMQFVRRTVEKFAARNTARNVIGSPGAETYQFVVGTAGFTVNPGNGTNSSTNTATYAYHDPEATRDIGGAQFSPAPASAAGQAITVKVKTGYQFEVNTVRLYYTTDGSAPEGSGGVPKGTTQVVSMAFDTHGNPDGTSVTDWWTGTIPAQPGGKTVRYKIGAYSTAASSIFPGDANAVDLKKRTETVFQITNFNATTAKVRLHNDYGPERTGLSEGFHVLRARAFLNRGGRASVYNTWTQTFYYDTQTPGGEIKFPAQNDGLGGSNYGAVARTNSDVTDVWYHIDDGDPTNDDAATGAHNGNGSGPEPFTDTNGNGVYDSGEPFMDVNGNGVFDANLSASWQRASEVTPSLTVQSAYPREWRFDYKNIPSSGTATIRVRLLEVSSSKNLTLTPTAAWQTELTRTVNTSGPSLRMFTAFPQQDGQVVGAGYVMKVRFSNALEGGLSEPDLRSRFAVKIASQLTGENVGGVLQPAQALPIIYNSAPGYDDFQFALPNLDNGNPDFLHTIEVTMTRPGNSALVATRLVKAQPVTPAPFISITTPPEFDSDGKRYEIILPDVPAPTASQRQFEIDVETASVAQSVSIVFMRGAGTATLISDGTANPGIEGDHKIWRFLWTSMTAGSFTFEARMDTDGNPSTIEARDTRDATVLIRQMVASDPNDTDDDDDGISDVNEQTITDLPTTDPSTWTNAQVQAHFAYGLTNPNLVDSDGDGLPDGLELGIASATDPGTNTTTDTNGDGFPNFLPDTDPPLYNVTGNATRPGGYELFAPWGYDASQNRADLIAGTVTNPNKPDTDDDGLLDGVEDANRNGREEIAIVDGAGNITSIIAHPPTIRGTSQLDRAKLPAGAVILETDPNSSDTDGDGASDGNEDLDHDGRVSLVFADLSATDGLGNFVVLGPVTDTNTLGFGVYSDLCYSQGSYVSRRLSPQKIAAAFPKTNPANGHKIGILWLETDPRNADTDGDGLPDGWEIAHGLDPLDAGTGLSLRTGKPGLPENGPNGDPDGDSFTNLQEYLNGTDPRTAETAVPPPANSIVIGPQSPVIVGGVVNAKEFTDWTADDLLVLDEQDGDGTNNGGSDVYHANDGGDSSRDLVAFYMHDGGDAANGGDGNFYFRVDLADLVAYAENGKLDIYVVVNTGHPGSGEKNLPDEVDTLTTMGWQAVVACYSGNNGRVYVDTNAAVNTAAIGDGSAGTGVVARDQNTANGFKKAYFNSDLDSVEFSISRQALRDAGWNGLDAGDLLFQVFTTKDGTTDNPAGPGNIGGRSDIRDTIYDDYLASDSYGDQAGISGTNSKLQSYFGRKASNDRGRRVKVVSLIHGNQQLQPGSTIQQLINSGQGTGYYRPLDVHAAYGVPLTMHITPTLASAIQWASVDPASPRQYRDGPAFNARLHTLGDLGVVSLLGSTFSDHILDFFPQTYNASSISLANEYLTHFYGPHVSAQVLWNPERVAGGTTLTQIGALGFGYTFIDQQRHLFKWFGRQSSLSDDGYRLNAINGVKAFVINDNLAGALYSNDDNGLPISLRKLFLRKARSSTQDQVFVFVNNWEDFADPNNAAAYDANIRWMASHPWIELVTPDQIASGQVDLDVPADGTGNAWGTVARGTGLTLARVAHDYVDHATQEDYANWYNGQAGREESLRDKLFDIRPGTTLGAARKFGTVGTDGVANDAWNAVSSISNSSPLWRLARATAFSGTFETAFHNQTNNDLSKYSTGAYIYPDISMQTLAPFAANSQSQFRNAAIYQRVAAWAQQASAGTLSGTVFSEASDPDLDGENEYLLFNDRLFLMFESIGGRLVGGWARDPVTNKVFQAIGAPMTYAGIADEREGDTNISAGAVNAYRVSSMRDQFFTPSGGGAGTTQYVNDVYTAAAAPTGTGWRFTSSDGKIRKTVNLSAGDTFATVTQELPLGGTLYVRFGSSPHLTDLLLNGQQNLRTRALSGPALNVFNVNPAEPVRFFVSAGGGNFQVNATAVDRDGGVVFDTKNLRNLAETQQAEYFLSGGTAVYQIGVQTLSTITGDSDLDGLPDAWEIANGLDPSDATGGNGGTADLDGDSVSNFAEYAFGGNPLLSDVATTSAKIARTSPTTCMLTWHTANGLNYTVEYKNDPTAASWQTAGGIIPGTGNVMSWTDDGSQTGTAPGVEIRRIYRVRASTP